LHSSVNIGQGQVTLALRNVGARTIEEKVREARRKPNSGIKVGNRLIKFVFEQMGTGVGFKCKSFLIWCEIGNLQ
jgi:hypothetical protein